jgi:Alpha/beta hydrolase domain
MAINPPAIKPPVFGNKENGPIYPSYVPKTDADGNDVAGVRLPDVTVPLATYTGWALRSGPQANDGCEAAGQYIPFPKTKADRMNSSDPRLSVEERYPSLSAYSSAVERAIDDMIAKRLMLPGDKAPNLNRLVRAGIATGVLEPSRNASSQP